MRLVIYFLFYIDDILLASNDSNLFVKTKHMLSTLFDRKDLGVASYVLGIKIHCDMVNRMFKLSQKTYIENILKRFNMQNCSPLKHQLHRVIHFQRFNVLKKMMKMRK